MPTTRNRWQAAHFLVAPALDCSVAMRSCSSSALSAANGQRQQAGKQEAAQVIRYLFASHTMLKCS